LNCTIQVFDLPIDQALFNSSLFMDSSIKSLANELSKLFQAQLNSRFIALKLLSIVAELTSKVIDMAITFNKLGYSDHLE
jgi:hypothetical protein